MKANLTRRLGLVERQVEARQPSELRGRYEHHYLRGWPEAESYGFTQCPEHGESCAKRGTPIQAPIVKQILFDGGGPFLYIG
jgi:hypothetical protein